MAAVVFVQVDGVTGGGQCGGETAHGVELAGGLHQRRGWMGDAGLPFLRAHAQPEAVRRGWHRGKGLCEPFVLPPRGGRLRQHAGKDAGMSQRGEHGLQGAQAQPAQKHPLKPPRLPLDPRRHLPRQEVRESRVAGVIRMPSRRARIRQIHAGHRRQRTCRLRLTQDVQSLHALRVQLAIEKQQAVLRLAAGGAVNPCLAHDREAGTGDFVIGAHGGSWM